MNFTENSMKGLLAIMARYPWYYPLYFFCNYMPNIIIRRCIVGEIIPSFNCIY